MLSEASAMCRSPPPLPNEEIQGSLVYNPVSALWNKVADLNEEVAALGYNNMVHFSPGVLTHEVGGEISETAITEQGAETILEDRRNKIVDSIFVPCEQPLLEAPQVSKAKGKVGTSKTANKEPTRRSTRQQVLTNSVPVSKRATHRLIKAFELAGPSEPIGEQALEEYIRSFDTPMTEQRVKAVCMLTSLDSGPVLAAAAQLAVEQEMTGAEEVAA